MVNSVSENAYENEEVAQELLNILKEKYPQAVKDYYKIDEDFSLAAIAQSRNWIVKNSQPDTVRTAVMVLTDFRAGRIGRFVLDDDKVEE